MANVSRNRFVVSIVALCTMFATVGFAVDPNDANDIIVNQGDLSATGDIDTDGDLTLSDGVIDVTSSIDPTDFVVNGDFASASDWGLTLFTISTGKARASLTSGQQGIVSQTIVGMEVGKVYDLTYTMTISGGGFNPIFRVSVGGNTLTQQRSSKTAFTEIFTAHSNANLIFTATSTPFANDFTIDDVIITERNANTIIGELDVSSVFTDAIILDGERLLPPFWENLGDYYVTLTTAYRGLDIIAIPNKPHILRNGLQVISPPTPSGGTVFEVFQDRESIDGIGLYNYVYSDSVPGLTISELDNGDVEITVIENLKFIADSVVVDGAIAMGTLTHSAAGDTDDLDVTSVNTIFLDTNGNDLVIGAFIGGVDGQVLHVAIVDTTNDATLEHNEGTGNQNIFLNAGGDELIDNEYGGWILVCNGTSWFETGNSN